MAVDWHNVHLPDIPVGTPVAYYPIAGRPERRKTYTRSATWRLSNGQPIIKIDGQAGGVSLDHLRIICVANRIQPPVPCLTPVFVGYTSCYRCHNRYTPQQLQAAQEMRLYWLSRDGRVKEFNRERQEHDTAKALSN